MFDSDPINFAFIGRDRLTYDTRFSSANAPIIVFKPHRSKAVIYDGPTDEKSVSDFINNVLGGGGGPWENLAIFKDQFVTDDLWTLIHSGIGYKAPFKSGNTFKMHYKEQISIETIRNVNNWTSAFWHTHINFNLWTLILTKV